MDPAQCFEQTMIARRQAMVADVQGSVIQQYYEDATVFITGASGFLGKQLVEKLLRDCKVRRIYLLLRPKKGKEVGDRLKEILEDPVFSLVQHQTSKITCLQGDVSEIRLGLSDQVWNSLADEVEMIFHVAATTRFDEHLQTATLVNVRGTREALLLGKQCKKLRSFVYVSTAYSHATADKINKPVYEKFYETSIDPDTLIRMAENMDPDTLQSKKRFLTAGWPNTYTFVKAVAEEQVRSMILDINISIIRPSIVISAMYEPSPGWMDSSTLQSASGILLTSGIGIIHTIQSSPSTDMSLVPVDFVNNATIAAGWAAGSGDGATIYNVVMSQDNKLTYRSFHDICCKLRDDIPMPKAIYLPYVFPVQSHYMFIILSIFLHFIPAAVVDLIFTVIGKKRRFLRMYKKIFKLCVSTQHFLHTTYYLDGTNTEQLFDKLSATDKALFNFNMRTVKWYEVCKVWVIGIRKYILKDELKNTDFAKKKQFWFKYFNYIVMSVYLYIIWMFIQLVFKLFGYVLSLMSL